MGNSKRHDRLNARLIALNTRFDQIVNRLDRLDVDQRSTNDLAQLINDAVDRVESTACTAHENASAATADIHGLTEELAHTLIVASAARDDGMEAKADIHAMHKCIISLEAQLAELTTRYEATRRATGTTFNECEKRLVALEGGATEPSEPPAPRKLMKVAERAIAYAEAKLAAGLPVVEIGVFGGRKPNGDERIQIRDAFESIGLLQIGWGVRNDPYQYIRVTEKAAA